MPGGPSESRIASKLGQSKLRIYNFVLTEVGLIVSLVMVIGAFRIDIELKDEFVVPELEQAVVELEEIEQTQQIERPPPPPRPAPPVMVPNDEILEDEILDIDAEIDLDDLDNAPLPPPPPDPYEEEPEPEIFVVVEEMPVLKGGLERLQGLVEYPELAVKAGLEGLVIVQFVVERDGKPTNPVVVKSAGSILDEAALEAVYKLDFIPGKQRGVPVRVKFSLPVRFNLTSSHT